MNGQVRRLLATALVLLPAWVSAQPGPASPCATLVDPVTGSTITEIVVPSELKPPGTQPGVCVYLPPGYDTSGLRYPVMVLLHGGLAQYADWVVKGEVRRIMDQHFAADPSSAMIVVMPWAGEVSLGPPHENEQFTLAATAAETSAGDSYFQTTRVVITRSE